jgi:hypothetical protein
MYFLRLPFTLPPDQRIGIESNLAQIGRLSMTLDWREPYYVLIVGSFPDESAARNYSGQAWAGLTWVMLQLGITPNVAELQSVCYIEDAGSTSEDPSVAIKAAIAAITLTDGSRQGPHSTSSGIHDEPDGSSTISVRIPAQQVLRSFAEGIAFPSARQVLVDPKLRLATELFAASFTGSSINARFITLMMSLEALAESIPRTQLVLDLVSKWTAEADEVRTTVTHGSDDAESLEAVREELLFWKEDAVRRQIQHLVYGTLAVHGNSVARTAAMRIVEVYDFRRRLVRDGYVDPTILDPATTDAKTILGQVLRAKYASIAIAA